MTLRFLTIPVEILRDLNTSQAMVWGAVHTWERMGSTTGPAKPAWVAEVLHLSPRWVRRVMAELRDKGFLSVKTGGHQRVRITEASVTLPEGLDLQVLTNWEPPDPAVADPIRASLHATEEAKIGIDQSLSDGDNRDRSIPIEPENRDRSCPNRDRSIPISGPNKEGEENGFKRGVPPPPVGGTRRPPRIKILAPGTPVVGGDEDEVEMYAPDKKEAKANKPKARRKASGEEFKDRPSERWEWNRWRDDKTAANWSGRDVVGYWVCQFKALTGEEDREFRVTNVDAKPAVVARKCAQRYVETWLNGKFQRGREMVDLIFRRAEAMGKPLRFAYYFTPSHKGAIEALEDKPRGPGRGGRPETMWEKSDRGGTDQEYWAKVQAEERAKEED